jgi:hypothetical protein
MATQENARKAPVVVRIPERGDNDLLRLIPAALVSVLFHTAVIVTIFFLPIFGKTDAAPPTEQAREEAVVQAQDKEDPALSDPLITADVDPAATDPDVDINFNNDRKHEVSVPGIVNKDAPVGILNGDKNAPPMNIPAPYGLGGIGQGGALDGPIPGFSDAPGMPGGYSLKGMPLAGTFYGRSGGTREQSLREGGGTKESEAAVARGLQWIKRMQQTDGSWRLDDPRYPEGERGSGHNIAATAFGLLPLLGAGYTHKKGKNNPDNPFDKPIEKALAYLIRKQDKAVFNKDKKANKSLGNFGGNLYDHGLATIAMSEAYGLSQDPWLKKPTEDAVRYLIKAQADDGSWGYSYGSKGDTSIVGWCVMGLKSAQMSGIDVTVQLDGGSSRNLQQALDHAKRFLDAVCDTNSEGYGYRSPGGSARLSAVGLLCRQYLQAWGPQNLRMIKGVDNHLMRALPTEKRKDIYFYYYATQVMHHFGGQEWKKWNDQMREVLVKTQIKTGKAEDAGAWSAKGDPYGNSGSRLMITSLSLLTLEVYYRHLPLYYRDAGEKRIATGN